jgi:hypothetical protein
MIEQPLRRHWINPAVTAREANPEVKGVRLIGIDVACRMQNPRRPGTNRTNERRSERFSRVTLREIRKCRPHIVLLSSRGRVGQGRGIGVMGFGLCMKRMPPAISYLNQSSFATIANC